MKYYRHKLRAKLERCFRNSTPLGVLIMSLLFICIAMVIAYFCSVSNDFSMSTDDWGNFGSYLGSVTGILAFVGVLYSIQLSEKSADRAEVRAQRAFSDAKKAELDSAMKYSEDKERSIFFQLLDLHIDKSNSVGFKGENGAEAFKKYVEIANKNLNTLFMGQIIKEKCKDIDGDNLIFIYKNERNLFNLMEFTYHIYYNGNFCTHPIDEKNGTLSCNVRNMMLSINNRQPIINILERYNDDSNIASYLKEYINECPIEMKSEFVRIVADFLYKEYGHMIGHYFRNMYYVMDIISKFYTMERSFDFKAVFRAQLSRYELALGIFNAVSSNSSSKMVELLEIFNLFKDVYPDDLTLLKAANEANINPQEIINGILDEYKTHLFY